MDATVASRMDSRQPGVFGGHAAIWLALLAVAVAFRPEVFFAVMALTGSQYQGSEESSVYRVVFGGISVAVGIATLAVVFRQKHVSVRVLCVLLMPVLMLCVYLLDDSMGRTESGSSAWFLLSLVTAFPAALAGFICSRSGVRERLAWALEPMIWLFTAAVLLAGRGYLEGVNEYRGVGGATYQTSSYMGALAFNVNLYYVVCGRSGLRPKCTESKAYGIACILLLPAQVLGVLLSGGRGGFVLMVVGMITVFLWSGRAGGSRVVGRVAAVALLSGPLLVWGVAWLAANPASSRALGRVFQYIGEGGIDWDGTSGRGELYSEALATLESAPFFGYGAFSWGIGGYPHNLVLEWLLNGGVVYLLIWLLVLIGLFVRILRLGKASSSIGQIVVVATYPLVMLQFSGSFLASGSFWFVLGYALCFDRASGHGGRV